MRKITALLLALAAVGATAQTAAADTHADFQVIPYGASKIFKCITDQQVGVLGQYDAWGYYIDGCTVELYCPPSNTTTTCVAWEASTISTESTRGQRVTQNARLRVINPMTGDVVWFRDQSCSGINSCSNSDAVRIQTGQKASVQCNGVRENAMVNNRAYNTCEIRMDYEG
ncbi:MAG: hypothetical protein E6G10_22180 [Actinobacteria bacterium]|nr:MAG: hypothetical protein E6G10_22180 [Actinomycetota bacterium]